MAASAVLMLSSIPPIATWMEEAVSGRIVDPFAMCLSTVGRDGRPSSRIVYWRDVEDGGFVFYTNYDSHKGREISANSHVALNFHWTELERQIRAEGPVQKASEQMSDVYWAKRPRESQLSAWASAQSEVISGADDLPRNMKDARERFKDRDIPRPSHWGGYSVIPDRMEFWQGRPNRLHDRYAYTRKANGWEITRLSP